jgi:hypothetical protein
VGRWMDPSEPPTLRAAGAPSGFRRFQFCIERFQSVRRLFLQLFAAKPCLLLGSWKLLLDFIGLRGLKLEIAILQHFSSEPGSRNRHPDQDRGRPEVVKNTVARIVFSRRKNRARGRVVLSTRPLAS